MADPWYPHRPRPGSHNPWNPTQQGPDLTHPMYNRGGVIPGPNIAGLQPSAWQRLDEQLFASDGTNQVWTWESPTFDLRPGLAESYGIIPSATPINHEAALGQSVYLVLIVGTVTGVVPIAGVAGVSAAYWEEGNNLASNDNTLMQLTQIVDCTETLLSGGISTTTPFGASAFQFTPCVTSIRFWKLVFQLTIAGVAPITEPYFIQALLH